MPLRYLSAAIALAVCATLSSFPLAAADAGPSAPIVDVRGVDHVGLNVPDIDQATRFFQQMFGFQPVTEIANPPIDASFKQLFDMHASSGVKSIRMLRAGDGANIELFQFTGADIDHRQPHYDDASSSHIALYTDDIDKAVAALRAHGIKVLTDPIRVNAGSTAGDAWAYFITPWGSKMELVSYPHGQAGEKQAGVTLWRAPGKTQAMPDPAAVEQTVHSYVAMLSNPDAAARAQIIDRLYTDDTVFNDPEGLILGKSALNELIGKLLAANKGWRFKQVGSTTLQHGAIRVRWQFGPDGQPNITGEDVLTLLDGRIASTIVFLNSVKH